MRHPFYKGVLLGSLVAVVVLMAATALAGTGVGAVFNLGKVNKVNRTSSLSGTNSKKMLQVTNKGSGAALALKVKAGRPPLAVNSTGRVKRLNADLVDGLHAGELGRVLTAHRTLPVDTSNRPYEGWQETLTLPGLVRISCDNRFPTVVMRFESVSQQAVNWDDRSILSHPGDATDYSQEMATPDSAEMEFLFRNSSRAAIVTVVVRRVSATNNLMFLVRADLY